MKIFRKMNKVLVADDDRVQRVILHTTLEAEGYDVIEAEDGSEALRRLSEDPDIRLLVTDIAMPKMDGYELIKAIRQTELRYMYIIVLTSMDDRESLLQALNLGANEFLTKPVFPDELKLRLRAGTQLLKLESQEELIFSMAKLAESRSNETGFHLERVKDYTRIIARDLSKNFPEYGLTPVMADEIARVSPLHDIGKVAIRDSILHKPGKLTEEEFEIMKTHTTEGGKTIKQIYDRTRSTYLRLAYEITMFHHERWNGKGYPVGCRSDHIPLSARIMALADVYDALTTKRCYKDAFSHESAKRIILEEKGQHFDPKIVEAFLRQEAAYLAVKDKFQDE